ncbi:macro domain-containing protein [Streptomyces sp. NPDC002764]|uniref:macro domain-containing protein n=1 Tax=Streptomyces sp. NPDC002764 TaxID=3154428 RepID=UPI00332C5850
MPAAAHPRQETSVPAAMPIAAYRNQIALDAPLPPVPTASAHEERTGLVRKALRLLADDPAWARLGLRARDADRVDDARARRLLRAVLTVRDPGPLPEETTRALDALLAGERLARPLTQATQLPLLADEFRRTTYPAAGHTVLWQGDITTLGADAIVNAANSALLGCFLPMHPCLDNAIHSAAGPRLREDCDTVMSLQGRPAEPTGTAKITRGYHLPARYVLHTVGPVVDGPLHPEHERELAASYRACLDLAAEVDHLRTIAFCGISTGVFGYPKAPAARTALDTVACWLEEHPGRLDRVIFNVYADDDRAAYLHALTEGTAAR